MILENILGMSIYKILKQNINTHPHGDTKGYHQGVDGVFTKSLRSKFVNTCAAWAIILVGTLASCRTPEKVEKISDQTMIEQQSTQQKKSRVDDTITVSHKIVNDSVLETKIVRQIVTQTDNAARSLQNVNTEASRETHDTLTPAIVKALLKGMAFACIGYAVLTAGVFLLSILMVKYLKK